MATPEELEQDVPSHSASEGGKDEVDFSWPWHKNILLELVRGTGLSPENLAESLLKKGEDANAVETDRKQGYGPIHYIVTGKHKFKRELLLVLFVHGKAELDLTTTQHGMTALRLAVERGDLECVKILVALGADINIPDHYGKTALDIARLKSERKAGMETIKSEEAMLFEGREMNVIEPLEVVHPPNLERIDVQKYSKIAGALESVGALPGRMVNVSSPHHNQAKNGIKESLEEELTASCQLYKKMEESTTQKLQDKSYHPTSEQALDLVTQQQREVDLRRRFGSRILCLDGGGVRGLVQIEVLRQIEKRTGKKITDLFDWIVGTSTGGIIALALVYGSKSVHELQRIYLKEKRDVFEKENGGGLLSWITSKCNTPKLQEVLQEWLGTDVALNEKKPPDHPRVLIPAVYKKDTHLELHFFNNCFDDARSKELVWKVARYTSAAPFYFSEQDNYIDGGVLANNPSEDCLTAIQQHYRKRGLKLPISLLVSIGSGRNPSKPLRPVDKMLTSGNWKEILELLESAILNVNADHNCASRCQEQGIEYFRFNPPLENAVQSDETDNKKLLDMLWETRVDMHQHSEEMGWLVNLLDESELGSPHDY